MTFFEGYQRGQETRRKRAAEDLLGLQRQQQMEHGRSQEARRAATFEQQQQEAGRGRGIQDMTLINQTARALSQIAQDDERQLPQAYEMAISKLNELQVDTSDFPQQTPTRDYLGQVIAATQGVIGDPGRLIGTSQRERQSLLAAIQPALDEQGRLDPSKLNAESRAAGIALGFIPRAVGTGAITTATQPGLTEKVAESEATIKQRTKFADMTGASRAKAIDAGFERVEKIDSNIRNLDRAIEAIDTGASTGAIESRFFPTLRQSTVELEQVQKELGLDVVGSVTFGALSEAELDLALQTALPTKLEPQALRGFLVGKRAAQEKLRAYYQDQIDFLDQGGTIAGFLRGRNRAGAQAQQPTAQQQGIEDLVNKYAD